MKYHPIVLLIIAAAFCGCNSRKRASAEPVMITLKNASGMSATFCSNGARLMSLLVPDRNGKLVEVVAGFENPLDYDSATEPYFGATIGRYGNRIAGGKFRLDGKEFKLSLNNGPNTLHGGKTGFQYQSWELSQQGDSVLICSLVSPDGDNGFPGKLSVRVTYTLTSSNSLLMEYGAVTDQPTVVNLTNHAFFNLNGSGSILDHQLMINANSFLPVDSTLIPLGSPAPVKGTPFDFRISEAIGSRIGVKDQQLRFGKGYDHNFVLNKSKLMPAAVVYSEKTGIEMKIFTSEPGLQFYSGNFMKGENQLRSGKDDFRTAFCLETQHFPDSPNQPKFPSTVLRPGHTYHSKSIYAFSIEK
ncbi:aldose 1-epimerase [Mucilaginibacter pineti]|uniref:Aldose 1-epimerase n=1 Tax=Mucilaginibacter pineti TaxID=1391627 RepID=A0A1G7IIH0_9SPHI|nr:aldose epimerase family protein [Mucilaginibacter pineti]SDF12540.1 aldose 1-epimerase [Mucilaginibacter pineti]